MKQLTEIYQRRVSSKFKNASKLIIIIIAIIITLKFMQYFRKLGFLLIMQ